MKQHETKVERELNGNKFFVRPFSAFKAANISGEVFALLTPMLSSVLPIIAETDAKPLLAEDSSPDISNVLDFDAEKVAPHLARAADGISGDKLEVLLRKLLVQYKNISVQKEGEDEAELLTEDLVDELFCGETQDLYIMAFDVIKANYGNFFKKLGGQYGSAINALLTKV